MRRAKARTAGAPPGARRSRFREFVNPRSRGQGLPGERPGSRSRALTLRNRFSSFVVAAGLLEHLAEVSVLAAGRFQVEHEVLDAQAQVIQALLERADRLLQTLVPLPRLVGQ